MIMAPIKILESTHELSEKGNIYKLPHAHNKKFCSHIMLSAREKTGNFLEIKQGKVSEKCECRILIKVWNDMELIFRYLHFGDYYFESDNFHGIISIPSHSHIDPHKAVPKAIAEFKSHTSLLLNRYHNLYTNVFWENGYREITFTDNGTTTNLMNYFWKHPA
jgi:hypothetical protein